MFVGWTVDIAAIRVVVIGRGVVVALKQRRSLFIRFWGGLATTTSENACDSWTLTATLLRRIQAMEMRCYHKTLHISYKDHATYEEVHAKIQ